MKKLIFLFLVLPFVVIETQASSLSPNFVLNKMVKDRAVLKNIEIEGTVTDLRTHLTFRDITKIDFLSSKMSSQIFGAAGESLAEVNAKLTEIHPMGIAWYGVGMSSNPVHVKEFLDQLGITFAEGAQVKLKRIFSRPVWEMGETSTVLIEKDQFLFAGYEENHENGYEAEAFSTVGVSTRIPKTLHFRKGAVEVYSFELKSAKVNQKTISMTPSSRTPPPAFIKEWIDLVH